MTDLGGRRVAIVGPVPPIRGGIAHHTANVASALRDAGATVRVWTWAHQYPRLLYRSPQTDPAAAPYPSQDRSLRWWDPISWLSTASAISAFAPDVVFVPWVTPFHAVPYRVVLGRLTADVVMHVHNARPHEALPFVGPLTRLGIGPSNRIVSHSSSIADDLRELGINRPGAVVPHPPNFDLGIPPPPAPPPLRLLFLGFVRHYKGADLAVAALEHVDSVQLTIAGEFWVDVDEFRTMVEDRGLASRVEILDGYLPDDRLAGLLTEHHAVIAPYRSATQSGIVPLAFAAGRPVVATAVGGLTEVIDDGVNGVLADPDPVSIAHAIRRMAADRDRLAAGAAASVTGWDDYVNQVFATDFAD